MMMMMMIIITIMWNLKSAQVIPIVVGALGGVTRKLGDCVGKLSITLREAFLQKTGLLGKVRTLRKMLDGISLFNLVVWIPLF